MHYCGVDLLLRLLTEWYPNSFAGVPPLPGRLPLVPIHISILVRQICEKGHLVGSVSSKPYNTTKAADWQCVR
jgi:hypothetical protein